MKFTIYSFRLKNLFSFFGGILLKLVGPLGQFSRHLSSSCWLVLPAAAVIAALLTSGCSTSESTRPENSISPNDPEFDPDPEQAAKIQRKKEAAQTATAEEENQLLVEAMHYYDTGLFTAAKESFAKLQEKFPSSYYSIMAELKVADCNYQLAEYATAITQYQEFERLHPKHEAVPYAVLQIGNSHLAQYRGVTHDQLPAKEALKYFERVVNEFPSSPYAITASQSIGRCKETVAAHEAYVAEFYLKQGQTDASRNRLGYLQTEYAKSAIANAATAKLSEELGTGQSKKASAAPTNQPSAPQPIALKRSALASLAAETLPPTPGVLADPARPSARVQATQLQATPLQAASAPSPRISSSGIASPASAPSVAAVPAQKMPTESEVDEARAQLNRAKITPPSALQPVAVAASLACRQSEGKRQFTVQFMPSVVHKVALRRTAEETDPKTKQRSIVAELELGVTPSRPSLGQSNPHSGVVAVYDQQRCETASATTAPEIVFSDRTPGVASPAGPANKKSAGRKSESVASQRAVRVSIPLKENQRWRVMKLNSPDRLIAVVY